MKRLPPLLLILFCCSQGYTQTPEPRCLQNLCYDAGNKQVLIYGGSGKDLYGDLWTLHNNRWQKLAQAGPPPRLKSAFTFDSYRKCAVLFGGNTDKALGDTWEWDGSNWKQINIVGPSARLHCMAAYDAKNKQVILFGGVDNTGLLADTWGYDGKRWAKLNADGPKNCIPHGIMYDEVKQRVILVTLSANADPANAPRKKNEMWEWTGAEWVKIAANTPSTSEQGLQALSSFGSNGIVLLDGDDAENGVAKMWVFDGKIWTGLRPQGPSARYGTAMIFDKVQNRLILFGGSNRKDNYGDTWAWNGEEWKEVVPTAQ